jgi:hypothetical protein
MTDNNQTSNTNQKQAIQEPFEGSEGVIKNLSTLQDGNGDGDRESLLDQIVDTPEESQPAQEEQGGKDDTK